MKLLILLGYFAWGSADQVCYNPYGCFSSDEPFNNPAIQLPQSPAKINTMFELYTHRNPGKSQELNPLYPGNMTLTSFDPSKPTVMIAHGYLGNTKEFWVVPLIEALLNNQDHNVILIDWSLGATIPYIQAAGNTRIVGAQALLLLKNLQQHLGMRYKDVHLVGQGIGAHLLSYIGRDLRRESTPIARITAMDPAGPFFEYRHEDVRIDKTDAQFVDAIHTDTETIKIKGVGTKQEVGHLDFFPNGGTSQPGCWAMDKGVVKWLACSHYRSMELFIESINTNCPFRSYSCSSYLDFDKGYCSSCPPSGCPAIGWNAVASKGKIEGSFYARTNDKEGFCAHHYQVKFMTGSGIFADLNGALKLTITGDENTSETVELSKHYFPSGSTETMLIHTKFNHGDLKMIKVEHDRYIDNWYLYAVIIRPMWEDKALTGCFKKWINNKDNEARLKHGVEGDCPE